MVKGRGQEKNSYWGTRTIVLVPSMLLRISCPTFLEVRLNVLHSIKTPT